MSLPARKTYTLEEYLDLEDQAEQKHEFLDGRILRMAGVSEPHVVIASNIAGEMHALLKGSSCQFRGTDQKVYVLTKNYMAYPDGTIVCGEVNLMPKVKTSVLFNPKVIFEVLSPSTENYDRRVKFDRYALIESLHEIVFIHQDRHRIELFSREPGETFRIRIFNDVAQSLVLESVKIEIPLRDIYIRVDVPPENDEPTTLEDR